MGLIVGVAVTQEANDYGQLLPAVDRIEERLEKERNRWWPMPAIAREKRLKPWPNGHRFSGSLTAGEKLSRAGNHGSPSSERVCLRPRARRLRLSGGQRVGLAMPSTRRREASRITVTKR